MKRNIEPIAWAIVLLFSFKAVFGVASITGNPSFDIARAILGIMIQFTAALLVLTILFGKD